jgi:hypothetical protein
MDSNSWDGQEVLGWHAIYLVAGHAVVLLPREEAGGAGQVGLPVPKLSKQIEPACHRIKAISGQPAVPEGGQGKDATEPIVWGEAIQLPGLVFLGITPEARLLRRATSCRKLQQHEDAGKYRRVVMELGEIDAMAKVPFRISQVRKDVTWDILVRSVEA